MSRQYTKEQQTVINNTKGNMLVSASAGTGKTTVMVERLCGLLMRGEVDVSNIAVVTFTNLSASDMKRRLTEKLAEHRDNTQIAEQLERLDMSAICTLHSLCADILRNYFYVVDIDPSFSILDTITLNSLSDKAMKAVLSKYSSADDQVFDKLYQIFMRNRKEDALRSHIVRLYEFSRSLPDFASWYKDTRTMFTDFDKDNKLLEVINQDITDNLHYFRERYMELADKLVSVGMQQYATKICQPNIDLLSFNQSNTVKDNFEIAVNAYNKAETNIRSNSKEAKCPDIEESLLLAMRDSLTNLHKRLQEALKPYAIFAEGNTFEQLLQQTADCQEIVDKLVELVLAYREQLTQLKRTYGGLDFGDLEHLTLQVLSDPLSLQQLQQKYKLVFVDEYQDINAVQEAIIAKLSQGDRLFVVGDVKQSIYGFRGCDPTLFADKQSFYSTSGQGQVVLLNDNFRSNQAILNFVNTVCNVCMTTKFGGVDYLNTAQLKGNSTQTSDLPTVELCLVPQSEQDKTDATDIYDITLPEEDSVNKVDNQCDAVINYIRQFVGSTIRVGDTERKLGFGDIVILVRNMTEKATQLYNKLICANIPVIASFKSKSLDSKEVRDIINLLRVLDNQYNDVPFIGVCLSPFGKLTEQEIAIIKCTQLDNNPAPSDTDSDAFYDEEGSTAVNSIIGSNFVKRCEQYIEQYDNEIATKLKNLFELIADLRFYGYGTGVDGVVLRLLNKTNYNLYVQSLPNGQLRIRNLYAFINDIKDKYYAQTVDKFLRYIDESGSLEKEEGVGNANAVSMITMHGSKGLEFPVVIIPFVDSRFKFDNVAVSVNQQLSIAIDSYDFEKRTVAKTLSKHAVDLLNKIKQRQEELRLLYVALTRPKNHLVIVGEYKDSYFDGGEKSFLPQYSNTHADFIFKAYSSAFGGMKEGIMPDGVKVTIFDGNNKVDTLSTDQLLCPQSDDLDSVLARLNYVYPYSNSAELPSKVVSSALDNLLLNNEQDQPPVRTLIDDDRPKIGTAYHNVYEIVDFDADKQKIFDTIEHLVECGDIERSIADQLDIQLIHNTLNNKELRQLVNEGKIYHELPFMLNVKASSVIDSTLDETIVLQGILDMLVIKDTKAIVIDFKYTGNYNNLVERYGKQLASYRLAVQQICGIQDIECYVLSIMNNKLYKAY